MALNAPLMLVTMAVCIVWIQFWFLGLFRPNSKDAKIISIGVEGEELATTIIKQKLSDLGPMTFHEKSVGLMFILAIMLWVFRKPQFVLGWTERITDLKVNVELLLILTEGKKIRFSITLLTSQKAMPFKIVIFIIYRFRKKSLKGEPFSNKTLYVEKILKELFNLPSSIKKFLLFVKTANPQALPKQSEIIPSV